MQDPASHPSPTNVHSVLTLLSTAKPSQGEFHNIFLKSYVSNHTFRQSQASKSEHSAHPVCATTTNNIVQMSVYPHEDCIYLTELAGQAEHYEGNHHYHSHQQLSIPPAASGESKVFYHKM